MSFAALYVTHNLPMFLYKIRCLHKEIHWSAILEPHLFFILWLPVILSVDDFVPWMTTVWQFPQELPEGNQNFARWNCFCFNFAVMHILIRCFYGLAHAFCLCGLVAPPENPVLNFEQLPFVLWPTSRWTCYRMQGKYNLICFCSSIQG